MPFHFFNNSEKSVDFNNFWRTTSWRNLTPENNYCVIFQQYLTVISIKQLIFFNHFRSIHHFKAVNYVTVSVQKWVHFAKVAAAPVSEMDCIAAPLTSCGLWGCKNRPAPFPGWMS